MIKLTIIGAGSAVFTRRIVTDLLAIEQFKNMEIALQNIDPVRLKASHDLIDVISKKLDVSPKVTSHTDRRESLVGQTLFKQQFKWEDMSHPQLLILKFLMNLD